MVIFPGSLSVQVSWPCKVEPPLCSQKVNPSALPSAKPRTAAAILTHDLILLQVDRLQFGQGGQLLWEVLKLVPGQVNGLEVLEAADLVGEAMEVVAFQAELCHRREEGEVVREGEPSRGHQRSGQEDSENDPVSQKRPKRMAPGLFAPTTAQGLLPSLWQRYPHFGSIRGSPDRSWGPKIQV